MAYQTNDDKEDEQQDAGATSLLGGYLDQRAPMVAETMPGLAKPGQMPAKGSGPSVTGHVNFDSIYAANEDVAKRDASKMGTAAASAAQKAQGGLFGLQGKFAAQSGGTGFAPSANDIARSKGGGTAFAGEALPSFGGGAALQAYQRPKPEGTQIAPDTRENWLGEMKAQAGHQYGGPSSLQDVDGYGGVLKDYGAAQERLSGLTDDAHIQGELEKNAANPFIEGGSRLDAALIGQAGRPEFARLNERYKGLGGELGAATKASAETAGQNKWQSRINAAAHSGLLADYEAGTAADLGGGETAPGATTRNPWGYKSFEEMMNAGGTATGVRDVAHGFVNDTSPADALIDELGKAGLYGGRNVAEMFREGTGLGDDLDMQNTRNTLREIDADFGNGAAQWLFENLTAEQWASLKGMNTGAIYRMFQQMLDAPGGWQPGVDSETGKTRDGSEVTRSGQTAGEESQGTTADEETARTNAYRDGWGSSYDEQKRNGVQNPVNPNG